MIYITGDTHGDIDRFKQFKKLFPKYKNHVFVCGDFGFVWSGLVLYLISGFLKDRKREE